MTIMNERAKALAEQFEQANNEAIAAVEGCSDEQWRGDGVIQRGMAPLAAPLTVSRTRKRSDRKTAIAADAGLRE